MIIKVTTEDRCMLLAANQQLGLGPYIKFLQKDVVAAFFFFLSQLIIYTYVYSEA